MPEITVILTKAPRCDRRRAEASLASLHAQTLAGPDFELVRLDRPQDLGAVVRSASGGLCVFLRDDMIADPRLLEAHAEAQRSTSGRLAVGQVCSGAQGTQRLEADGTPGSPIEWQTGNFSFPASCMRGVAASSAAEVAYSVQERGFELHAVPSAACMDTRSQPWTELYAEGRAAADAFGRHRIPPFRAFCDCGGIEFLLRRLLLMVRVPVSALPWLSALRAFRSRDGRRALASYAYWSGVRSATGNSDLWRRLTQGVPILMYHGFSEAAASHYVIPRRNFERQMRLLRWAGFHVLGIDEFLSYRREDRVLPARSVIITLDDGYADNLSIAQPVLAKFGFPATAFIVTGFLGKGNGWDRGGDLAQRPLLNLAELRRLRDSGVGIGAHTQTHRRLSPLSEAEAAEELAGSRTALKQALETEIAVLSYPHGDHNPGVEDIARACGFAAACSSQRGLNGTSTPEFRLRRTCIPGTLPLFRFVLAATTGHTHLRPFDGGARQ